MRVVYFPISDAIHYLSNLKTDSVHICSPLIYFYSKHEKSILKDYDKLSKGQKKLYKKSINSSIPMISYVNYDMNLRSAIGLGTDWIVTMILINMSYIYRLDDSQSGSDIMTRCQTYSHINLVLINTVDKTIERFDPSYNPDIPTLKEVDEPLWNFLKYEGFDNYTYLGPKDYFHLPGPQHIETKMKKKYLGGYCGWWCLYYFRERIAGKTSKDILENFNTMTSQELYDLIEEFKNSM